VAALRRPRRPQELEEVASADPGPPAPAVPHALLALQRSAGNHAVARMLQRSALPEDEAAQVREDEAQVEFAAAMLMSMSTPGQIRSRAGGRRRRKRGRPGPDEETAAEGLTELSERPHKRRREAPVPMEDDATEAPAEEEAEPFVMADVGGETLGSPPMPQSEGDQEVGLELVDPEMLALMDGDAEMSGAQETGVFTSRRVARAVSGAMTSAFVPSTVKGPKAAKPWSGYKYTFDPNKPLASSVAAASNVGEKANVKRQGMAKGTGVRTNQRPAGWKDFLALLGVRARKPSPYIQGHLLYEKFGGRGEMKNLAPFGRSLNGLHAAHVEHKLKDFLEAGPANLIDYKVTTRFGTPANIIGNAVGRFREGIADATRFKAITAAMVRLNLCTAQDSAAVLALAAAPASGLVLPSGATWGAVCATVETWMTAYVTAAFPQSIHCKARLYQETTPGQWSKTPPMSVDIDNEA
jgi:DNA/RNA non-specific endonuclease